MAGLLGASSAKGAWLAFGVAGLLGAGLPGKLGLGGGVPGSALKERGVWGASWSRSKDQPGLRWSASASSCAWNHSSSACQAVHQEHQTLQKALGEALG